MTRARFSFGMTDPRGIFGGSQGGFFSIFDAAVSVNKNMHDVDTEVLRNLWLATFGDVPVSHGAMSEHWSSEDDIFWVGHELHRRKQIQAITMHFPDRDETFNGYALVREE